MNDIETIYDHIDLEYKHLDEIRKNITYLTRRMSGFHNYSRFTNNSSDARMMIDTYTQLYGVIVNHIEFLYEKANSFLNRRNFARPSENIVSGNYAVINGRHYRLDNIQHIPDTSNSLNRDNTRGRENSNEQTTDNNTLGTNRTNNVNARSTMSPSNTRRSLQPNRLGQSRSIWNAPTANISRETNLFGTSPTPSLDNLFQQVNNMNSTNTIRWPQFPTTTNPNNPFQNPNNRNAFDSITTEFFRTFSEPVNVSPSADQIRAATVTLAYSEIHEPINHQCPISLEIFQPTSIVTQIRHCRHAFMPSSFQTWFQSNVRCPICRHDIRENISSGSLETTATSEHSSSSATVDTQDNEEETNELNELPPLIPIEEEGGEASNDIEMGPEPEIPPPVPEQMPERPEPIPERPEPQNTSRTANTTHSQNENFTNAVETMLNEAVRNMLDDPSGNQQSGSNVFLPPLNLNTNAIGAAIFNNIMNHNYQNVEFDPSNNHVTFETTVFDSSWNPPG
jgi:hypothetical protein